VVWSRGIVSRGTLQTPHFAITASVLAPTACRHHSRIYVAMTQPAHYPATPPLEISPPACAQPYVALPMNLERGTTHEP
jgi:hypothetical protein